MVLCDVFFLVFEVCLFKIVCFYLFKCYIFGWVLSYDFSKMFDLVWNKISVSVYMIELGEIEIRIYVY